MGFSELARLLGFLLGTFLFIVFMGMDVWKAFKRGVYWVPGNVLVLSALTIQIMNFVENESNRAFLGSKTLKDEIGENNFVMMHGTRVMICVLVAFFLPGVARASYENKLTKIAALGLTVFIDIFSEFLTLYRRFAGSVKELTLPSEDGVSWVSFMISDVLISIALLWLILLLICAARASTSIQNITNQRVPFILAQDVQPDAANNWEAIENQVLKSWIVVYVCYPPTIIAKSVLTSSAALVVTICIVSSIVGWVLRGQTIAIPAHAESRLKLIITMLEIVFILTGWAVIGWRSLASVRYHERWKKTGWREWFKQYLVEDFWTGCIQEELEKEKTKNKKIEDIWTEHVEARQIQRKLGGAGESFVDQIIPMALRRRAILRCVLWLQFIAVIFSKVSSFLIEVTFYNGVIRKIVSVLLKDDNTNVEEEFEEYKAILENVTVVGEDPKSVFATSRKAIRNAQKLSKDGYKEGKGDKCKSLIRFLKDKTSSQPPQLTGKKSPPLCVGARGSFVPAAEHRFPFGILVGQNTVSPFKFLSKTPAKLEEEAYFKYMIERSWSWKLTAVSLINIIVSLCPKCGKECVKAYSKAWQLMDMVDKWDPKTDSMLTKGADREFDKLMDRVRENSDECCETTISIGWMAKKITELANMKKEELEEECKKEVNGRQSSRPVDWEKLAAAISLYKLYSTSMYYVSATQMNNETESSVSATQMINETESSVSATQMINETESSVSFADLKNELKRLLADVIAACMDKVGIALVVNCKKWAQKDDQKEEKFLKAIFIAGKSKGLLEALGWKVTDYQIEVQRDCDYQIEVRHDGDV